MSVERNKKWLVRKKEKGWKELKHEEKRNMKKQTKENLGWKEERLKGNNRRELRIKRKKGKSNEGEERV